MYIVWDILGLLTHCGRVTYICISKLTIIGLDDSISTGRCQAIIWINAGVLLIGPLGTNFYEIWTEIHNLHSRKSIWKSHLENGGHLVSASMFEEMIKCSIPKHTSPTFAIHDELLRIIYRKEHLPLQHPCHAIKWGHWPGLAETWRMPIGLIMPGALNTNKIYVIIHVI